MNLLDEMRFRGIFGTPQPGALQRSTTAQPGTFTDPRIIGFDGNNVYKGNNSPLNAPDTGLPLLRKSDTPSQDAYKAYLENAPDPKTYKMGKLGQALAAISGVATGVTSDPGSGISQFQGLRDYKYNQARSDYATKGHNLKELAEIEHSNMTEAQKTAYAEREMKLKENKDLRDELKSLSDLRLDNAQIDNLKSQMAARGLSTEKNEKDGKLYVIDSINKTSTPLGQWTDSLDEKTKRDFGLWKQKEDVSQAGRRELQASAQAAARSLENLRSGNDLTNAKALATLRSELTRGDEKFKRDLEGMSIENQARAFKLAGEQAIADNPKMDTTSPEFLTEVRKRLEQIRNRTTNDIPTDVTGKGPIATVPNNTPTVTNPTDIAARQAAVAYIKAKRPDNPELLTNEDAIQDTIKYLAEEAGKIPSPEPQVTLPPSAPAQAPLIPQPTGPTSMMGNHIIVPQHPYAAGNPNPFSALWNAIPPLSPAERARRGY